MRVKLHPLEKIAKQYFGVTDSLEEAGYVLSDGTFLDLSGRHIATGYERRGDRFVPMKRQSDYLYGQRSIDHRQLPSEILDAVGTREGSAAMFAFLRETGALRFMPGAGFLVAKMPTIESVARVVREWHHAFGREPLYVDVVSPGSLPSRASRVINPYDVRESEEFERPTLEAVVEFLESKFIGASMGAAGQTAPWMLGRGQGDVEFYMGGACPIFAIALHRLTKFPMAMLIDETQPFHPSAFSEAFPTIAHVFVVTPDGQALDIRGIHTFEALKADYPDLDEPKIQDVSLKELRSLMGGHSKPLCRYDVKEIEAAERVAKRLLSSHQRTD